MKSKLLIYLHPARLAKGANCSMRLESEIRKLSTLEQRFVHGRWRIIKIYIRGKLHEIVVKHKDDDNI